MGRERPTYYKGREMKGWRGMKKGKGREKDGRGGKGK